MSGFGKSSGLSAGPLSLRDDPASSATLAPAPSRPVLARVSIDVGVCMLCCGVAEAEEMESRNPWEEVAWVDMGKSASQPSSREDS